VFIILNYMQSIFKLDKKKPLLQWKAASNDALETKEDVLNRVRRKLVAARVQSNMCWEELFRACDRNKSGSLDWKEFKGMVRDTLRVPPQSVCDHELKVLFTDRDKDGNAALEVAEFLEYLQRGARRPEEEETRLNQRLERVRRNVQMAFSQLSQSEADVRSLFQRLDKDNSGGLSPYEFSLFIRQDLKLSCWHVQNADLESFYKHLDQTGDGIDVEEFLAYIRQCGKAQQRNGPESFYVAPANAGRFSGTRRRRKTYKEQLEDGLARSESCPVARISHSSFASTGRDRRPASRVAASAVCF